MAAWGVFGMAFAPFDAETEEQEEVIIVADSKMATARIVSWCTPLIKANRGSFSFALRQANRDIAIFLKTNWGLRSGLVSTLGGEINRR
jgi:hypothetical protein